MRYSGSHPLRHTESKHRSHNSGQETAANCYNGSDQTVAAVRTGTDGFAPPEALYIVLLFSHFKHTTNSNTEKENKFLPLHSEVGILQLGFRSDFQQEVKILQLRFRSDFQQILKIRSERRLRKFNRFFNRVV